MKLRIETEHLQDYLTASRIIDFDYSEILELAQILAQPTHHEIEIAKTAYNFVRDKIPHSCDIHFSKFVTCEASSVLKYQEGICFAKSHLLAAILRALNIPTGFCYQKLLFDDAVPGFFTLHGLNAIYLESQKRWIRVDARGNKPGVNAQFSLEQEQLAYPVRTHLGEIDYPIIYTQPNSQVITALKTHKTLHKLIQNLPQNL